MTDSPIEKIPSTRRAAEFFIANGWPIIPVHPIRDGRCSCGNPKCPSPGKHPIATLVSHGIRDASRYLAVITAWWDKWPDANIGIATGEFSGIDVLDIDPRNGGDDIWGDWKAEYGYPDTIEVETGGGGFHLYFKHEPGVRSCKPDQGIDFKSDGGYVLAPPSNHISGKRYNFEVSSHPGERDPAPLPSWLKAKILSSVKTTSKVADPIDDEIPEGSRNEMLASLAGTMRRRGMSQDAIEAALLTENENRCHPPLDVAEVQRIAKSVARYSPGSSRPGPAPFSTNGHSQKKVISPLEYQAEDGGILDVWKEHYGNNWRFLSGFESWYLWAGTHWEKDSHLLIQREIQHLLDDMNTAVRSLIKGSEDEESKKILKNYLSATKRTKNRVSSIETMAQAERAIPAKVIDSGNVLNLKNGTLDLNTLELRPHNPDDLLTYCLPYAFDASAIWPRWNLFLEQVLVHEGSHVQDLPLTNLVQELVGYSLTTDTTYEVMAWLFGNGANGKSVLVGVLQKLLGPLSTGVDFHTLGQLGNYDLAKLPGMRVIFSTESAKGQGIAENWLKRIVSGETIHTRPIYGKPIDFPSVAKVWWGMNDRPYIRDSSDAIWRRLKLIPFNRTFSQEEQDINLSSKLEKELPGILNWALIGLQRLRKNGRFTEAGAAESATDEFKRESNPVLQWVEERTNVTNMPITAAQDLYEDYKKWAKENGRESFNSTNFGRELTRLPGIVKDMGRIRKYNLDLQKGDIKL